MSGFIINPYSNNLSIPEGMVLWLAAWKETGYSDGDAMATIKDWSGNGRDFTQATSGSRPQYKTGILNSQPAFRFDGTDDFVERTAFMSGSVAEMFCVLKIPTGIGGSNWGWMKFSGHNSLSDHFSFFGTAYSTFGGTNRTNYTVNTAASEAGLVQQIVAKGGASAWKWYEAGNVEKTNMTQTMDWGTSRHLLGASSGNSDASSVSAYFNGWICELQIFNSERTTAQRNSILADFQTRYGLSYTSF